MIRRNILEDNNFRYVQGYLAAEDFMFLSNLLEKTNAYCIQKPLYYHRWHGNNISIRLGSLQVQNFYKISLINFRNWLKMDISKKEHEQICGFFRGPNTLEELPAIDKLIKAKLDLNKTGAFGISFQRFYGERLLDVYEQEGMKGLKNLGAFLKDDVWRYLPFRPNAYQYLIIIARSLYRSIIK